MPLLDRLLTQQLADEGIARVAINTDQTWKELAYLAGVRASLAYSTFTADQIWQELEDLNPPPVHNKSAMGPILRLLCRDGWIEPAGIFARSDRPATHGRPLPLWRARGRS